MPKKNQEGLNAAEIAAKKRERIVVEFKNIDNETFTHSYEGLKLTIHPGEKKLLRLPEAEHYAKHLARKIAMRAKTAEELKKDDSAYTHEDETSLANRMIVRVGQEGEENLSAEESHKKDLEQLQAKYGKKDDKPKGEMKEKEETKVTKHMVLKELRELGKDPDPSLSLPELLQMRTDLEMQPKE